MKIINILRSPYILIVIFLFSTLFFAVFKKCSTVTVDSNGFVKDVALNFAITADGAVLVSTPDGNVILESKQDSKETIHSISITTEKTTKNEYTQQGLLNKIISVAYALPAGKYVKIKSNVDGQLVCRWYSDHSPC